MFADLDVQCIMIMGDNPLTAVHVIQDVEIVDWDALIHYLREDPVQEGGMNLVCSLVGLYSLLWILGFPSSLYYICMSCVLQLLLVT